MTCLARIACVLLSMLAGFGPAAAGTDPDREWFTVHAPHFAIHTYDGGEALAREVAAYCEEARTALEARLGWAPEDVVHVVLVDDTDSANGFAGVLPYNAITLYAFPPSADSELGHYTNWMKLLVFHEYAHIVHIDQSGGLPRWVNLILGRAYKPNEALPRWVTEGLATWIESATSGVGRVGASRMEMHLRTQALAGRTPTLAELTGAPIEHPRGTMWYLYGGYLFDHIDRHAGPEAVARFAREYGSRPIPYGMNAVARSATGKTLLAWFEDLRAEIHARAEATAAAVRAKGLVEGAPMTTGGERKSAPRFTADGRHIVYVHGDGHTATWIVQVPLDDPARRQRIAQCYGGCGTLAITRDGADVIYDTTRRLGYEDQHGALRRVRLGQSNPRRGGILVGPEARAHDPAVSPDGKLVWYVRSDWGRTSLRARSLATGDLVHRFVAPGHGRVDHPAPSPDGSVVYVSMNHAGDRDLYEVRVTDGRFRALTEGGSLEIDPVVTADGRWLVYSTDATGIYNIHARELSSGVTHQLTNVLTGAFSPTVSPDGQTLVYSRWSVDGDDLHRLPFRPSDAPVVEADPRPPIAPSPPVPVAATVRRDRYEPLPTMLPRSWVPTWVADSTGVSRLGLTLSGVDATGRFGATISGEWDATSDQYTALAALHWTTGAPDLSLSFGRYTYGRSSFVGDTTIDQTAEVLYGTFAASISFPNVFTGMHLRSSYTLDVTRDLDPTDAEPTPDQYTARRPFEGLSSSLELSWTLNDARSFSYNIATLEGFSAHASLRIRDPAIGSHRANTTLRVVTRAHLPMPFDDHVLSLRVGGGIAGGARATRSRFVIGGVPPQDVLVDLLNESHAGGVWLRGFEPAAFSGPAFELATLEYRLPLYRVRSGLETLPVFVNDLTAAVFTDVGRAHEVGDPFDRGWHAGAGVEIRWSTDLFFGFLARFRVGYAHGFGDDGIDHVYFLLAPQP